jgi:hypothetical protein
VSPWPWTTSIQVRDATLMRLQAGMGTPAQLESPPQQKRSRSLVTIQLWQQLRPQVPAHQRTTSLPPTCRQQIHGASCAP